MLVDIDPNIGKTSSSSVCVVSNQVSSLKLKGRNFNFSNNYKYFTPQVYDRYQTKGYRIRRKYDKHSSTKH